MLLFLRSKFKWWAALCLAALPSSLPAAEPAEYPSRPIRLIVPSAAGGAPDYVMRVLAAELASQMGQQIVIDNRAGGGGIIGIELLARSVPDGYTIAYGAANTLAINPALYARLPYDVGKQIQPVAQVNLSQNLLSVRPTLQITSVAELIDFAKKNPDRLKFGSVGNGTSQHLSGELFKQMSGTQMVHVPYKSVTQALTELIAGQIDLIFDNLTSAAPHVKSGRLRALAVTGPTRTALFPALPTVAEAGLPKYEVTIWGGVIAPAGIPKPILARLNAEINKACAAPSLKEKLVAVGNQCIGGPPEQYAAFIRKETAKWAEVVKRSGAKID